MSYSVTILLTFNGSEVGPMGPFDLYSDVDGYTEPFESCLLRQDLDGSGYVSHLVPEGTQTIRIKTNCVDCNTYVDVNLITPSPSITPSITPSISVTTTPSVSVTPTPTVTSTPTPTRTPTRTPSVTSTPSLTVTPTPSVTTTPMPTPSYTMSVTVTPSVPAVLITTITLATTAEEACYGTVKQVYCKDSEINPGSILYHDEHLTQRVTGYGHIKLGDGRICAVNTVSGHVGEDTGYRCHKEDHGTDYQHDAE